MSLAAARSFLQQKAMEDQEAYADEYDTLMDQKKQQETDAGWGKLLGQWGLVGLGATAAVLSGGALSPLAAAALGGIGARAGSELGETNFGRRGQIEDNMKLKKRTFGRDVRRKAEGSIKDTWEGFNRAQDTQALTAVAETYKLAGGDIPGTKAFSESGGLSTMFQNPINAAPGTAAFGLEAGMSLGDIFSNKFAIQRLSNEGFDLDSLGDIDPRTYEAMMRKANSLDMDEFGYEDTGWTE